jgi:membrane protein YqaA with SNARE-associated domain
MPNFAAYAGLFSTAFIAATIFPLQSETVLVGMIVSSKFSVVGLVVVASVGNTLGAVVNWFPGRWIEQFRDYRWMPIVGDGLTVIAGVLREPLLTFTILVLIAKTGRYVILTLATLQLIG